MLGLLLIYYLGKQYYKLAEIHARHQWLYAILGVLSYYFGTFVAGIFMALTLDNIEDVNDISLSLMGLPVGLLCAFVFYRFLEYRWERIPVMTSDKDILDAELIRKE